MKTQSWQQGREKGRRLGWVGRGCHGNEIEQSVGEKEYIR